MSNTLNEKEREEVSRIAYGYEDHPESDMDRLRKLDAKAKRPAQIFAYTFGILGTLVLGVGMCLAMKVIGDLMPLGIIIGVIGIVMVCVNYPAYRALLKKGKKKYAEKIAQLSGKLLNE